MKVKPIGDRILVQPLEQEEMTKSGIILPASAEKEKKAQGKIIALGNGEEIKRLGLKEGDVVVFGKYSGDEIEIDGKECKMLYVGREKDESDVLATVE
ncbi:co-chaperone GroES [Patescibacteria group bacterium]|nr:co-chaperone GroES [Patescibacteria group bacterium]